MSGSTGSLPRCWRASRAILTPPPRSRTAGRRWTCTSPIPWWHWRWRRCAWPRPPPISARAQDSPGLRWPSRCRAARCTSWRARCASATSFAVRWRARASQTPRWTARERRTGVTGCCPWTSWWPERWRRSLWCSGRRPPAAPRGDTRGLAGPARRGCGGAGAACSDGARNASRGDPPGCPFPAATDHHLHRFTKVQETPSRFPRRAGMARKRPLGS